MNRKKPVITNILDFIGPPAVQALLEDGYCLFAHEQAFQNQEAHSSKPIL
ncbi:hypothetical protein [Desulfopila inferna]|nr:hypothetical protein [Desulfopila inferna]MBM9606704.1 hypothetical protein [Desulfopila inferna]